MTAAPVLAVPPRHRPTGNLEVHLPENDPDRPQVNRVGVVSLGLNGTLDLVGAPLLEILGDGWTGQSDLGWLPQWENHAARVTALAPYGERGFAIRIEPKGNQAIEIRGGADRLVIGRFREEDLHAAFETAHDPWTGSFVLAARVGHARLGLGIRPERPPSKVDWGPQFRFRFDGDQALVLYVGVAPEADGARTTALHLTRVGWDALYRRTAAKLESLAAAGQDPPRSLLVKGGSGRRSLPLKKGGRACPERRRREGFDEAKGALREVYRRNLSFGYFYAQAEVLEGGTVLLTSRSPHYYVSGAYWARDSLLWFFPLLLGADPARAATVLEAAFARYALWPGEHAQYVSGPPLYPGFELDQAAAYVLALARYLESGGERDLVTSVAKPLAGILRRIGAERHPQLALYRTFLSPTDDPVPYPYLTYDNALLSAALTRLSPFLDTKTSAWARSEATAITDAIYGHGIAHGPFGSMFAFAFEPAGPRVIADEPAGSLLLLPHLSFCTASDAVFRATKQWIFSARNPHHYDGAFPGEGSAHFPFPSGFSLANRLLLDEPPWRDEAVAVLQSAPLDTGLVPESYDAATGHVCTGAAFATLAAFVAYALRESGV